jgi:hypothetical protein
MPAPRAAARRSPLDVCEGSHAVTLSPSADGRRVSAVRSYNAGILRGVYPERRGRAQNDNRGEPILPGPEGRESVAQGETCPDAFYREPWGNRSPRDCVPLPRRRGGGGQGGRGRARKPIPRGGTVGHLLAPLPGLLAASSVHKPTASRTAGAPQTKALEAPGSAWAIEFRRS